MGPVDPSHASGIPLGVDGFVLVLAFAQKEIPSIRPYLWDHSKWGNLHHSVLNESIGMASPHIPRHVFFDCLLGGCINELESSLHIDSQFNANTNPTKRGCELIDVDIDMGIIAKA